jgi:hypothetical protein
MGMSVGTVAFAVEHNPLQLMVRLMRKTDHTQLHFYFIFVVCLFVCMFICLFPCFYTAETVYK